MELDVISAEHKALLLENLKKRMAGASVEPYEVHFVDEAGVERCVEVKGKKLATRGNLLISSCFTILLEEKKASGD